jgi:hypothetical protein
VDAVHSGSRSKPMDQACLFTMSQAHGPATRLKSICTTWHSQEPTRVRAGLAQTGPTQPVSSPDPAHKGPVSVRSRLTVDR